MRWDLFLEAEWNDASIQDTPLELDTRGRRGDGLCRIAQWKRSLGLQGQVANNRRGLLVRRNAETTRIGANIREAKCLSNVRTSRKQHDARPPQCVVPVKLAKEGIGADLG